MSLFKKAQFKKQDVVGFSFNGEIYYGEILETKKTKNGYSYAVELPGNQFVWRYETEIFRPTAPLFYLPKFDKVVSIEVNLGAKSFVISAEGNAQNRPGYVVNTSELVSIA